MKLATAVAVLTLLSCAVHAGTAYYVSPGGDDVRDGRSIATGWKTCAKVNGAKFEPGDTILFECGGKWREQLKASSSGADRAPIVYGSYGKGAAPQFIGSDILANNQFKPAGGGKYTYALAAKSDAVLQDHVFIESSWTGASGGVLTLTLPDNPATNGKVYTACTRGNVIFSNRQDHLVFDNLVADETAGQLDDGTVQGYGFRIEGGTDVKVSNCEANRCGRHNFAAINTAGFVGIHLRAAYAQPKMPGGNTFYASYGDSRRKEQMRSRMA